MLKAPKLRSLYEFETFYDDEFGHEHGDDRHHELRYLGNWIASSAVSRVISHNQSTNRDEASRPVSQLRKVSVLHSGAVRQVDDAVGAYPEHPSHTIGKMTICNCRRAAETAIKLYAALREPAQEYFDMELLPLGDRHAVVAHAYDPGAPAGESHVDILPTVPCYITGFTGDLYVANDPDAVGIEAITADAVRIQPSGPSALFFDGRKRPHVVSGVALEAPETRTSLALTYLPADPREIPDVDHPRLPKIAIAA